ncbi:hypothetical protein J4442_01215 [Candidatus Woesearchaeota archaeon]|nr:hypothetical protein [Candidatus Woesearchaeota archaeon]
MIKGYFKGIANLFSQGKYLDWGEYERRISTIEGLTFMTKTCQKAVQNHWQKEGRKW